MIMTDQHGQDEAAGCRSVGSTCIIDGVPIRLWSQTLDKPGRAGLALACPALLLTSLISPPPPLDVNLTTNGMDWECMRKLAQSRSRL